jgi:hypothetical protein
MVYLFNNRHCTKTCWIYIVLRDDLKIICLFLFKIVHLKIVYGPLLKIDARIPKNLKSREISFESRLHIGKHSLHISLTYSWVHKVIEVSFKNKT